MWTIADNDILVNLEAVRSVGLEVSDDRQFVEVQVRWANDGERFPIVTLIVQDFETVSAAMAVGQKYVDALKEKLTSDGMLFKMPNFSLPL